MRLGLHAPLGSFARIAGHGSVSARNEQGNAHAPGLGGLCFIAIWLIREVLKKIAVSSVSEIKTPHNYPNPYAHESKRSCMIE